jgi:hypothetical protein
MLSSLIHTETGSASQYKLAAFEEHRLLQSLFGCHHHTLSLMEERSEPAPSEAEGKQSPPPVSSLIRYPS